MSGAVYVDGFCIENGTSTGTPSSGPGATTSSSSVPVPTSANSVSVVAEATGNLPIRVVLLDPAGLTLASSDNTSGFATLTVPVSQAGTYSLQVINLGAGPVEVWTAATPNVRR